MDLRKKILHKRDQLSADEITQLSLKIQARLRSAEEYVHAKVVLFFHSFKSEVDTLPEIKRRLTVGLPTALPRTKIKERRLECYLIRSLGDLVQGSFSIMEPDPAKCQRIDPGIIDAVIVPGSVFDRRCGRFGYGGGFYDRFLLSDAPQAVRIALAFSFQVMDNEIPVRPHDQFMDLIVTEKETIRCKNHERRPRDQEP